MIQTENEISKLAIYGKTYRAKNKDAIKIRKKIYEESHKEQIAEHKKQYYIENIETLNMKKAVVEICSCGSKIRHHDMYRHLKTELHDKKLNILLMKEQAFDDFYCIYIPFGVPIEQIVENINTGKSFNLN